MRSRARLAAALPLLAAVLANEDESHGYKKEGEASIVDAIGAGGEMFASKLGSRLDAAGSLVSSAAGAVLTPEALDSLAQKRKSLATWVGKASGAY